jgi:hypothetical protein
MTDNLYEGLLFATGKPLAAICERLGQQQIAPCNRQRALEAGDRGQQNAELLWFAHTNAYLSCRHLPHSAPAGRSCWRGRCPQSGDQRQDFLEHLS